MTDPRRLLEDPAQLAELEERVLTLGRDARPSDDFARELWSSLSAQLPPVGGDPGGSAGTDGGGLGGAGAAGLGAAGGSAAGTEAAASATLGASALVASIVKASLMGAVLGAAVMTGAQLVTGARSDASGADEPAPTSAARERGSTPATEAIAAGRTELSLPVVAGGPAPTSQPGKALPSQTSAPALAQAPSAARAPEASDPQPLDPRSAGRAAASVAAFSNTPGEAPAANAAPLPVADGTREESRLVAGARRALRSGDSQAALELLDRTTQKFPAGVLAQEREALAIEALVRSGRRDAARQRAAAFLRAFPASPHAARVRALVSR